MDFLPISLLGIKVAIVTVPLAVSVLACSKKQKKNRPRKNPKAKPNINSSTKSVACKDPKSACTKSTKDKSTKSKKPNEANDSVKVLSQKSDSKRADSLKANDSKTADKSTQIKPEESNSIKESSKKSAKVGAEDKSSKKSVEDSRKDESHRESTKSVSVKADSKDVVKPMDDASLKKASGGPPKEAIVVEPKEIRIAAAQDVSTKINLENKSDSCKAIKIKCSDNGIFHINPVYALVEPNNKAVVEVLRSKGKAKPDKLAVVVAEADADAKNGQEVFKSLLATDNLTTVTVPIFAS